tara:strand:+ start:83 stop:574 length:492 start_codon:yes stop_codon:yes gene_type:complete
MHFGRNFSWESVEIGCNDTYRNGYSNSEDRANVSHSSSLPFSANASNATNASSDTSDTSGTFGDTDGNGEVRAAVDVALNWTVQDVPSWVTNVSKVMNPTLLYVPNDPTNASSASTLHRAARVHRMEERERILDDGWVETNVTWVRRQGLSYRYCELNTGYSI